MEDCGLLNVLPSCFLLVMVFFTPGGGGGGLMKANVSVRLLFSEGCSRRQRRFYLLLPTLVCIVATLVVVGWKNTAAMVGC